MPGRVVPIRARPTPPSRCQSIPLPCTAQSIRGTRQAWCVPICFASFASFADKKFRQQRSSAPHACRSVPIATCGSGAPSFSLAQRLRYSRPILALWRMSTGKRG